MGRLVRILIYALIILILYFWVSSLFKSYYSRDKSVANAINEADTLTTDMVPQDTSLLDTFANNDRIITNEEIVSKNIDYKDVDMKVKELEEKKTSTPTPSKPATSSSTSIKSKPESKDENSELKKNIKQAPVSSDIVKPNTGDGGKYAVMAGSYLLKVNANKMITKLKTLGFTKAEIIVFPASEYHSVIAGRYATEALAKSTSRELKQRGVDTFVKKV